MSSETLGTCSVRASMVHPLSMVLDGPRWSSMVHDGPRSLSIGLRLADRPTSTLVTESLWWNNNRWLPLTHAGYQSHMLVTSHTCWLPVTHAGYQSHMLVTTHIIMSLSEPKSGTRFITCFAIFLRNGVLISTGCIRY